jgi:hypothetical protein
MQRNDKSKFLLYMELKGKLDVAVNDKLTELIEIFLKINIVLENGKK